MTKDLQKLAEYYDKTDLAEEIDSAELDDVVDPNPMITTSLRLPKTVLDRVRTLAAQEGMRPTALIRRWVEKAAAEQSVESLLPKQTRQASDHSALEVALGSALRRIIHEELRAELQEALAEYR